MIVAAVATMVAAPGGFLRAADLDTADRWQKVGRRARVLPASTVCLTARAIRLLRDP